MEYAREHNEGLSTIDFKHLTISFDDYIALEEDIKNLGSGVEIASGAEAYPIAISAVYTEEDSYDKTVSLKASIKCHRDDHDTFDDDWKKNMLYELECYYNNLDENYIALTLPGEEDSLYIVKDINENATLIRVSDSDSACDINISTVSSEYIYYALGYDYHESNNIVHQMDSNQLYETFNAWAKVQNIIYDQRPEGWEDEDYKHIFVSLPNQSDEEHLDYEQYLEDLEDGYDEYIDSDSTVDDESYELTDYLNKVSEKFEKIGGNFEVKERLTQIAVAYTDPEGAAMFSVNAPSFLLHGQPGTGKTEFVEAFAKGTDADLIHVDSVDIQSKTIGDTAKLIDQVVEDAMSRPGRVVIFFDEIDTLIHDSNHLEFRNAAKHLGRLIDDINQNHPDILIAACMNASQYEVMESITRSGRLEVIHVKAPETYAEIRDTWFSVLYRDAPPLEYEADNITVASSQYSDVDIIELAKSSVGLTGADMQHILSCVRSKKMMEYRSTNTKRPISQQDIYDQIEVFISNKISEDDEYI